MSDESSELRALLWSEGGLLRRWCWWVGGGLLDSLCLSTLDTGGERESGQTDSNANVNANYLLIHQNCFTHLKMRGHHPCIMQWNMHEAWNWCEQKNDPKKWLFIGQILASCCSDRNTWNVDASFLDHPVGKTFWNVNIKLPNWQTDKSPCSSP